MEGEGDLPPQTVNGDVRAVQKALRKEQAGVAWEFGTTKSAGEVRELIRGVLAAEDAEVEGAEGQAGGGERGGGGGGWRRRSRAVG